MSKERQRNPEEREDEDCPVCQESCKGCERGLGCTCADGSGCPVCRCGW